METQPMDIDILSQVICFLFEITKLMWLTECNSICLRMRSGSNAILDDDDHVTATQTAESEVETTDLESVH